MTFLSLLPANEIEDFIYLVFRGIIPKAILINSAVQQFVGRQKIVLKNTERVDRAYELQWFNQVKHLIRKLTVEDVMEIASERQVGYLHFVESMVHQLGFQISDYIELMGDLIMLMLLSTTVERPSRHSGVLFDNETDDTLPGDDAESELDETAGLQSKDQKEVANNLKIRKLSILRFTGFMNAIVMFYLHLRLMIL